MEVGEEEKEGRREGKIKDTLLKELGEWTREGEKRWNCRRLHK